MPTEGAVRGWHAPLYAQRKAAVSLRANALVSQTQSSPTQFVSVFRAD
jgi:hypothetical protein